MKGKELVFEIHNLIKKFEKETGNTVTIVRYGLKWDDEKKELVYDLTENFVSIEYKDVKYKNKEKNDE